MGHFKPYTIKHFYLDQPDEDFVAGQNYFLVIWCKNFAIGHFWIDTALTLTTVLDFRKLVEKCLIDYAAQKGSYQNQCAADLHSGQYASSVNYILSLQTPSNDLAPSANSLSVVVCTRNRSHALKNCIEALLESTDSDFELIIVDNAPSDNSTELLVQSFQGVKYFLEPNKGLDFARNTGAFHATGDLVAYTDDDVIIHRDWIKELKNSFRNPLTMAVTGLVLPISLQTKTQYIFEKYWGFNRGYQPVLFDHAYFLAKLPYGVPVWDIGAGANMAFRKEIFDLIGYFDNRLDAGASGCSGDSEYWYRILAEGWNCQYQPSAIAFHQHRDKEADLTNQLFSYMRGQVSSLLVQHEKYGHRGNLKRLYRGLPQYYYYRLKDRIFKGPSENFDTLLTEIKGCISGWKYYQRVKHQQQVDPIRLPMDLKKEVIVKPNALVSVIITCYNYGQYLAESIESVLNQSYQHTEIIVVDDGSTDNTPEVLKLYPQVRSIRTERVGLSAARNIGTKISQGDFLVFLDADDYLYSNAIELNLFYFSEFPLAAFISGAHDRIDQNKNYLATNEPIQKDRDQYASLLLGNYIAMEATVLYRRELFFCFHFDPKLAACEDYDLNLQVSRHLPSFTHTTKIAAYRMHQQNMSGNRARMLRSIEKVFSKQKLLLQNKEEEQAFETGLKNWKNYYSKI